MKITTVIELHEMIQAAQMELEELKSLVSSPPTSKFDGLSKVTAVTSRTENYSVKILDYERRLCNLREEKSIAMLDLSAEINRRVQGRKAAEILFRHYVMCEPFAEIAESMSLTKSAVYYFRRKGCREYETARANSVFSASPVY